MKTALVTTTINVPTVLKWYRACSDSVRFFVACDLKTPCWDIDLGMTLCMSSEYQKALGYKSSEIIGWNTDSRRNIAVLEALRWGADLIISIDDDMIPLNKAYFTEFEKLFAQDFGGLQVGETGYWVDPGKFTVPPAPARGLPPGWAALHAFTSVTGARIGAAQGIILGVPDTSAVHALANQPVITGVTDILKAGFVVDPFAFTVFNSQTTAFRRELAPAFAQFYRAVGRNTDIYASLIMRRVMRDQNLYTHYGPPSAFHARKPRENILGDLQAEMFGVEHVDEFATWLAGLEFSAGWRPLDMVRSIYRDMVELSWMPREVSEFGAAWCDDCESVL